MKYKLIYPDVSLWQRIVDGNQNATFFHTPTWSEIITEAFPMWKNATFIIEFEDRNYAVVPLVARKLFHQDSLYWYESMGLGSYGGPIFLHAPSRDHLFEVDNILNEFHNIQIVCNPFSDWKSENNYIAMNTYTHVLPLQTDFSEIQKGFAKSRREAIRYARRQGVEVKEACLLDYLHEYLFAYKNQIKRWGSGAGSQYSLQVFETIANYSLRDSSIKFWIAMVGGKLVSGVIGFFFNRHAVLWHNATLTESMKYRPVDMLYSSVIEAAASNGITSFDFGKSGGNQGLIDYKEHFGAHKLPITIYKKRNFAGNLYRGIRLIRNKFGVESEG